MYKKFLMFVATTALINSCADPAQQPERCSVTPGLSEDARAILREQHIVENRAMAACI